MTAELTITISCQCGSTLSVAGQPAVTSLIYTTFLTAHAGCREASQPAETTEPAADGAVSPVASADGG